MSMYSVDTGKLSAVTARASVTVERLRAESQMLKAELTELQSTWSGSASAAFQTCSDQWAAAQLNVEQVLESISAALRAATTTYSEAETYTATLFQPMP